MLCLYVSVTVVVLQSAGLISTCYLIARPTSLAHLLESLLLLLDYRFEKLNDRELALSCIIGRSRPPAPRFCQAMAQVPNGSTTIYDDGARRHRHPEVRSYYLLRRRTVAILHED